MKYVFEGNSENVKIEMRQRVFSDLECGDVFRKHNVDKGFLFIRTPNMYHEYNSACYNAVCLFDGSYCEFFDEDEVEEYRLPMTFNITAFSSEIEV